MFQEAFVGQNIVILRGLDDVLLEQMHGVLAIARIHVFLGVDWELGSGLAIVALQLQQPDWFCSIRRVGHAFAAIDERLGQDVHGLFLRFLLPGEATELGLTAPGVPASIANRYGQFPAGTPGAPVKKRRRR